MTEIIYIIMFLFMVIIYSIFPYITRKTICFGVNIPEKEKNNKKLIKLKRNYVRGIITISIFLLIFEYKFAINNEDIFVSLLSANIIFSFVIFAFFYLINHKKVKILKEKLKWENDASHVTAVDTKFRNTKMTISHLWFILYGAILVGTFILGYLLYDRAPNELAVIWDIDGDITHTTKSLKVLFYIPTIQLLILFIFIFVFNVISNLKQQISSKDSMDSVEKNRIYRYSWSVYLVFLGLIIEITLMISQLIIFKPIENKALIFGIPLIMSILIFTSLIIMVLKIGQGGSRIKISKNNTEINREDDKNWKLGIFYFNPDDPSVFIEKRFGIGWTCNWGNALSWIILIGIFLIASIFGFIAGKLLK